MARREFENNFTEDDDVTLLARCIWGEARGEPLRGKFAVGLVVRNRVRRPSWWGRNYPEVILFPWQFSVFNENDPNRAKLLHPMAHGRPELWWECVDVAAMVVQNEVIDFLSGATHYIVWSTPEDKQPDWAKQTKKIVRRIGRHAFYSGID